MTHHTVSRFWRCYSQLSPETQAQADKQFVLLKSDRSHPSVRFKKVGRFWSARVNDGFRALAVPDGEDFVWFWIGDHEEDERIIKRG